MDEGDSQDFESFKLPDIDEADEDIAAFDLPYTGRSAFVYLVDGSEAMYNNSGICKCLEACKQSMMSMCRKQRKDLTAVVLFNTKVTRGEGAPPGVVLLEELAVPKVQTITNLNGFIEDDCSEMKVTFGHSSKVHLHQYLQYAQRLILKSKEKTYVRYIVLFTCTDNPYPGKAELELKARKQVEEFPEHGIDFDVVGLGENFDSSKFYKELVLTAQGELLKDWDKIDPVLRMDSIVNHLSGFTDRYSRRVSYINLSEDYQIHVALHKLYAAPKAFKLQSKMVPRDDLEEEMKPAASDGGEEATQEVKPIKNDAADWHSALTNRYEEVAHVGNMDISIKRTELKERMIFKRKGFDLIGFVKSSNIPFYYSYGEPYVVIPYLNEKNNLSVFSHLLNKCLAEQMSILCWFTMINNYAPILCALHPVRQSEYAPGRVHPQCFVASKLRYSDMLYEPDFEPDSVKGKPSEKQLEAMTKIITSTSLSYSVDKFFDVNAQHKINMIEALAFGADTEETVDCTLIKLEQITDDLASMVMDCSHLGSDTSAPVKRRGTSDGDSSRSKMPKKSTDEAFDMIKKGLAHKLTVPDLKSLLTTVGVKHLSGMTKAQLVDVANQHFNVKA